MKITVYKFDPSIDAAPYYIDGEVPFKEKMTAMEALLYFHRNIAPVNYDSSCGGRLCGRCSMLLNGEPCMICVTPIEDKDYTFEPLPGYPIIRDLIVDKSVVADKLSNIYNRVRIEPYTEETYNNPKDFDFEHKTDLYALEFCARCGACTAACPVKAMYGDEFAGPMELSAYAYRYLDPLDQGDRLMEAVSAGLFRCIECGKCDEVCAQQDIHHVEIFKYLKEKAIERGIKPSYA